MTWKLWRFIPHRHVLRRGRTEGFQGGGAYRYYDCLRCNQEFNEWNLPNRRTFKEPETYTGLYHKFHVTRIPGNDWHKDCYYFVLDTTHDRHALPALEAYVKSCRENYPVLAEDLNRLIAAMRKRFSQQDAG